MTMTEKKKLNLAIYWAAGCGGCDVAILDINERILDVAAIANIVLWPIAMDFKYSNVEAMADKSIDVCLFNGAIRNSEQEHLAKLLRKKSKVMVAFGACASWGGIPALGNFTNRDEVFKTAYKDTATTDNPQGTMPQTRTQVPEGEVELPEFFDRVYSLPQVVPVEYFVPGCPPVQGQIVALVEALAAGKLPPAGSVIASDKALCDECKRARNEEKKLTKISRPHQVETDPKRCLLEQGVICMGPVTRSGCGSRCPNVNMPCRGCFGPAPGVEDQGARMVSAIASIYQAEDEATIKKMVEEVVDPAGTFYRFTLSSAYVLPRVAKSSNGKAKKEAA